MVCFIFSFIFADLLFHTCLTPLSPRHSPVFFSTTASGTIVEGLAGFDDIHEGLSHTRSANNGSQGYDSGNLRRDHPLLVVGNHQLFAQDMNIMVKYQSCHVDSYLLMCPVHLIFAPPAQGITLALRTQPSSGGGGPPPKGHPAEGACPPQPLPPVDRAVLRSRYRKGGQGCPKGRRGGRRWRCREHHEDLVEPVQHIWRCGGLASELLQVPLGSHSVTDLFPVMPNPFPQIISRSQAVAAQ